MKLTTRWAQEEFGAALLGDVRRTRRVVQMAARAAASPSGRVSAVFEKFKEREGAYDFLESPQVRPEALAESVFAATAERATGLGYSYVVIDGSSLSLSDAKGTKGFGPVGTRTQRVQGLMVNSALAVAGDGTPLGLIDQTFWSRSPTLALTKAEQMVRNQGRSFEDKEPAEIVRSAERSIERLARKGVRAWVVVDRVADNRDILLALSKANCVFTVRANYNRPLSEDGRLREDLAGQPCLGRYEIEVGRTGNRAARRAVLELRAKAVELVFRSRPNKPTERLALTAVWLHEPSADKGALDWMLFTNAPVDSIERGRGIVEAYRTRWRIEEFHRTWKRGHCNVEDAQLRSEEAMVKWATVLAAVATRIERLKYSSRHQPDQPAITVLSSVEIEVLQHEQRQQLPPAARRRKRVPIEAVTIREATCWIASLGGWMGEANGPPGSITLARGLERLGYMAQGVLLARAQAGRRT
jgi:hypothetical protein